MSGADSFTVLPFPRQRGVIVDAGWLDARRHLVYGLLEIDVTRARQYIRARKAEGDNLSFTAFIVKCLADAVKSHPMAHALRDWRGRLVIFDDVDVVTMIETEKNGVALPHVVRGANRKSFQEISAEIRAIQARPRRSEQTHGINKLGPYMPGFLRRLFFSILLKNPFWIQKFTGTTILTSVGMFGKGSAWGIAFLPWYSMGVTVGGIAEKPAWLQGKVEPREYLSVTLTFDHDVVDGAPAARFGNTFKELVEAGCRA